MKGMSLIARTVVRILSGPLLVFGGYLILHCDESHGMGFAGGVIIALTLIQTVLAFSKDGVPAPLRNSGMFAAMITGLLAFVLWGAAGICGLQLLPASGNAVVFNLLLCVTAAAALLVIFSALSEYSKKGGR